MTQVNIYVGQADLLNTASPVNGIRDVAMHIVSVYDVKQMISRVM